MEILEQFPATAFFGGVRRFELRSLPKGAKIRSARFTFMPLADAGDMSDVSVGPAIEELRFVEGSNVAIDEEGRPSGVTRTRVPTGPRPWVEVDFHGRRTLLDVSGSELLGASLQVDIGGLFLDVGINGTVPASKDLGLFALSDNTNAALPGLTVSRVKLTAGNSETQPDVTSIRLLSVAANLALAFAGQPSVWAYPGEVATVVETTELAEFLQLALNAAEEEGGFALIPVTLTSSAGGRLAIAADIEFDAAKPALPDTLPEATLSYDFAGNPAHDNLLKVKAPAGTQVAVRGTRIEVVGSFDNTEIVHGPLIDRTPAGALAIASGGAVAQPFALDYDAAVDAVDILVSTSDPLVRLEVDLRGDFDGKPDAASLLTKRAAFAIDNARHRSPRWVSVKLAEPVRLRAASAETGKPRTWLVLQSLERAALWYANAAAFSTKAPKEALDLAQPEAHEHQGSAHSEAGEHSASALPKNQVDPKAEIQVSNNGGLSWRQSPIPGIDGSALTDFRLRRQSSTFKVPLTMEIGRGYAAERISFAEFDPLGRVEFAPDPAKFAGAANRVLEKMQGRSCPRGEQLANGDFADRDATGEYVPAGWAASGGAIRRITIEAAAEKRLAPKMLAVAGLEERAQSLSQVAAVSAGCPYELSLHGMASGKEAVLELIWRTADCRVSRVDSLTPFVLPLRDMSVASFLAPGGAAIEAAFLPVARLRSVAPADAAQAELRLLAPAGHILVFDRVSFTASPQSILNSDFKESRGAETEGKFALTAWSLTPADAASRVNLKVELSRGLPRFVNEDAQTRTLTLSQRFAASPGAAFDAAFSGAADAPRGQPAPTLEVAWLDANGAELGTPTRAEIKSDSSVRTQIAGDVPDSAVEGEVRLSIPPEAATTIAGVTLEQSAITPLPVTFLSAAPGELTIRAFDVALEPATAPAPPEPANGPCVPTPADAAPGDVSECDPCGKHSKHAAYATRPVEARSIAVDRGALPATADGQIARVALLRRLAGAPARMLGDAEHAMLSPVEIARPTTHVRGIGPARAAALARLGITNVRRLAATAPSILMEQLRVPEAAAIAIAAEARKLLDEG